jgi:hypothetical protein
MMTKQEGLSAAAARCFDGRVDAFRRGVVFLTARLDVAFFAVAIASSL